MTATLSPLDRYLTARPDRCGGCGHHAPTQGHGEFCVVAPSDEWVIFVAALRSVVRADKTVHACDVRPIIRGRIEPKRIGQAWKRARSVGLLVELGHERSDDDQGRNRGRMEPFYELRGVDA